MNTYKKYLRYLWALLILTFVVFYSAFPESFTPKAISTFLGENKSYLWFWYVLLSVVRAIFFIPSTVLVLTGILLFPNEPWEVFIVSMLGILVGSSIIYFAADWLRPEALYKKKSLATKMETIHNKMEQFGPIIILIWAFIPIVPTDLICYISGTIKLSYWKFILALGIGEALLVAAYVFAGQGLFSLVF